MNTNNAGGGQILNHVGKPAAALPSLLNDATISQFGAIPIIKIVLYMLIMLLMVIVILKLFNIKSPFKSRGIKSELNHIEEVKRRDANIVKANKFMAWVTVFIEKTPLSMGKTNIEYWQYNISRAGLKIPGGSRHMKAIEFHALIQILGLFSASVSLLILILLNSVLGWILLIFTIIAINNMPMMILRQTVKEKDMEIRTNFADYYLMLHYVLVANANTPLSGIMRSYAKTTSSVEMHRFVDVCIHYIDTYGEYEATRHIAKEYRELTEIGKLMRLIRQANEGGEVQTELIGFRAELLREKRYTIEKRMEKLVGRAKLSFNILLPVLLQAILSAMSIYLSSMGLAKGLIGQ